MTPEELKQHQKTLGLNACQLAEKLGLSSAYISRVYSGERKIRKVVAMAVKYLLIESGSGRYSKRANDVIH